MSSDAGASGALASVSRAKARTRFYRSGHWFASCVFGVVILASLPFYIRSTPGRMHCRHFGGKGQGYLSCSGTVPVHGGVSLLGRAFEPQPYSSLGGWSTFYWVVAIVVGFAAVVVYYQLRARRVGVQGRIWPAVLAGIVLLGLATWASGTYFLPGDYLIRGTSVLVVIAGGLLVLSALERSRPFVLFALGFLGLALLGSLYDVSNLFGRLGIDGPFIYGGELLPNLILPGAYLVIGGVLFRLGRGRRLDVHVHLTRPAV